ncbi:YdbH domain-containing protein [Paraglaciecola sp. L3A3]|uniref:intermembrane phospholipid transport protein YdbH family protein n=1 Tax=Paraglaciecola sp. L3A3 TaxID=2686358 RepID=UPI00131C5C8B|nr:YdbH domain-containing protein [Paraglaciecola sp. L3A3]
MTQFFRQVQLSKTLKVTVLLITVFLLFFIFRRPIVSKSIEYFTQEQELHISCLDFSFDWPLKLNIQQVCVTSPMAELIVNQAIWQPWSNEINIEQVKVTHFKAPVPANNIEETQTNELALPSSLPSVQIAHLEIDSYLLLQPIYLTLQSKSHNQLNITGDLNALVTISTNALMTNLHWRLSDLTKYIPQAQTLAQANHELLKDAALEKATISSHLSYDGKTIQADNSLDISGRFHLSNCPIDLVLQGNLLIDVALSNLDMNIDLSQLTNNFLALECPLVQNYFVTNDQPQLSFVAPKPISVNSKQISLAELQIVDEQNANRAISLNQLHYKTSGEFESHYKFSIKQPIQNPHFTAEMFNLQGSGKLFFNLEKSTNQASNPPLVFTISDDKQQLLVNNLQIGALAVAKLTSEFSFNQASQNQLTLSGMINSEKLHLEQLNITKTMSNFSLSGVDLADLQLSVNSQVFHLQHTNLSLQSISNNMDINIKELADIHFTGSTKIINLVAQNIDFQPISVSHTGQTNLNNSTLSSEHTIELEQGGLIFLQQQQSAASIFIEQQNIVNLQKIISQLEPKTLLKEGKLSANVKLTLSEEDQEFMAQGEVKFHNVSAKYKDYLINNINYQTPLMFNSAGLQLAQSNLLIESIDVGVTIEQIETQIIAQNSLFTMKQLKGEIFNGQFSLANLWLDGRDQQFNVNFKSIDLAQIMALQQQPGIKITGTIDGDVPMIMDQQGIRVEDGWMSSLSGGKLTIVDNPSFDSIKAQQPELALLENLDFTKLESKVKFTPDGWVFFDLALQGSNPDKKQAVNFNYSHEENIFSLLESIRLVNSVENRIEQKITQGEKK